MMRSVAVIGIDGISWNILKMLFDRGIMPYLKHVIKRSLTSTLKSTLPPLTYPAWTSIATGVNPGKHGVYGFLSVRKGRIGFESRITTAHDVKYPRIHELLGMFNIRSLIMNVPATYPPDCTTARKTSVIVSDWLSPEIKVYPRRYEDLERALKTNLISKDVSKPPEIYKFMRERVERIIMEVLNVIDVLKPNFLFLVFSEPDWIMHKDPDFLKGYNVHMAGNIFNNIDSMIRSVHEIFDHVIIVSDHGFSLYNNFISVTSILKKGNVRVGTAGVSKPKSRRRLTELGFKVGRYKLIRPWARAIAKKIFKIRYSERVIPYTLYEAFIPDTVYPSCIYIKPGMEEYVIDVLKGESLLKVYRSYEAYSGPCVKEAPDVIVEPNDYSYMVTSKDEEEITHKEGEEGSTHHPHGVLIVTDFECNKCDMLETYDVVPIILHLMKLPIPSDTDSKLSFLEKKPRMYNYYASWKLLKKSQHLKGELY